MEKYRSLWSALQLASILGLVIALPLIIFTAFGAWLDKLLHTFPLFFLGGVIVGGAVSTLSVYKLILPFLTKRVKK